MTSRERVLAAFEHRGAGPRAAMVRGVAGVLGEGQTAACRSTTTSPCGGVSVMISAAYGFATSDPENSVRARTLPAGTKCRTPFGIVRRGIGCGQPTSHPLAEATLQQIHDYPWPDVRWMDVSRIRDEALAWGRQYAILGGDWSPFLARRYRSARHGERCSSRCMTSPELVDAVMRHVVDYYAGVSQRIFDAAADAIDIFFIGNDFGSRSGTAAEPCPVRSLHSAPPDNG